MAETPAEQVEDEPLATYWTVVLEVVVLFAGLLTVTVAKACAAMARKKRQNASIRRWMLEEVFMTLLLCASVRVSGRSKGRSQTLPKMDGYPPGVASRGAIRPVPGLPLPGTNRVGAEGFSRLQPSVYRLNIEMGFSPGPFPDG